MWLESEFSCIFYRLQLCSLYLFCWCILSTDCLQCHHPDLKCVCLRATANAVPLCGMSSSGPLLTHHPLNGLFRHALFPPPLPGLLACLTALLPIVYFTGVLRLAPYCCYSTKWDSVSLHEPVCSSCAGTGS